MSIPSAVTTLCRLRVARRRGNRMLADVHERLACAHVLTVQLATFRFEAADDAIELAGELEVRRARAALQTPGACDQHFEVVHTAEHVLRVLQRTHARRGARAAELANQLHRVPEFFHRDADFVEAVWQVHTGCVFHRGTQALAPPARTLLRAPESLRIRDVAVAAAGRR